MVIYALFVTAFMASAALLVQANPLAKGIKDAPKNEECIVMNDARAQEVKQMIQEITEFIDQLADKHEYFEIKVLKLDIGKYVPNVDSTTGLDLIVDDCNKPSAYDFSGDFVADSDSDSDSPTDLDTSPAKPSKYKITHSSRNVTQRQTNTKQQTTQTITQTAVEKTSVNQLETNKEASKTDVTKTVTNNYLSHTDGSTNVYHETTEIVPTADTTIINNDYQSTNQQVVGTQQETQQFAGNSQQLTGALQDTGVTQNIQQTQQYAGNSQQISETQQFVGNTQQITATNTHQDTNVASQQNIQQTQQYIENSQHITETQQDNSEQLTELNTQHDSNVVNQQNTKQLLTNVQNHKDTTTTLSTETNKQINTDNSLEYIQYLGKTQKSHEKFPVTNKRHYTEKDISEDTQEYVEQETNRNTDVQYLNSNQDNLNLYNNDDNDDMYHGNANNNFQSYDVSNYNKKAVGNSYKNEVSPNPRYNLETLLLKSLTQFIRSEVQNQLSSAQHLSNRNTNYDRFPNFDSLNNNNDREGYTIDGENVNNVRDNVNYGGGNANFDKENDNYDRKNVNYNIENDNDDRDNVNYGIENDNYDRANPDYDNIGYDRPSNDNDRGYYYGRRNTDLNNRRDNSAILNHGYDERNVDYDQYDRNDNVISGFGIVNENQEVVIYGNENKGLVNSKPRVRRIKLIENDILKKKLANARKGRNGAKLPLLVHLYERPGFQQLTIV